MKRNNVFLALPKDGNMYRQAEEIFKDNKKLGDLGYSWKSVRDVIWAALGNGLDGLELSVSESLEAEKTEQ